ncbi:MAG: hypothetical protein KDA91_04565 [Planctomycetaceae bacterium]|nr:hypothetical protein [Planctomycetaceae bacterium]
MRTPKAKGHVEMTSHSNIAPPNACSSQAQETPLDAGRSNPVPLRAVRTIAFGVLYCLTAMASSAFLHADEEKPIEAEAVSLGRPVEFERDIYPILEANCIACHNQALDESELILEDTKAILKGGSAGPSVVPGNPDESLLFKVAARTEEPVMPPWPNDVQAKKLTPRELGLLKQWIIEGAAGGSGAKSGIMHWQPINAQLKAVYSIDIDPNGRWIAAGRAGGVTVYDMAIRNHVAHLTDPAIQLPDGYAAPAHHDFVHAIAFHPSGDLIATSGYQEVKLWRRQVAAANNLIAFPSDSTLLCTSGDEESVIVASAGTGVALLNAATGEVIRRIDTDGQPVSAASTTSGERPLIAIALADGRIQTNDLATGELQQRSDALTSPVVTMTAPHAGDRMAALCSDGILRLLTVAADTGIPTVTAEIKSDAGSIQNLAIDGSTLITVTAEKKAELWKLEDATKTGAFDLPGPVSQVQVSVAIDRAVFVLTDGQTLLWSLKEPKQIAALTTDLIATRNASHAESIKALREARNTVLKAKVAEAEKEVTAQKEAEKKAEEELTKATAATDEARKKLEPLVAATAAAKKALEEKPDDAAAKKAVEDAEKAESAAKSSVTDAESRQQLAQKSVEFASAAVKRAEQRVAERKEQQDLAQKEAEVAAAAAEAAKSATSVVAGTQFAAVIADHQLIASTDSAGTVRIWNAADGQALDVLPAVTTLNESTTIGSIRSLKASGNTLTFTTETHQRFTRPAIPDWNLDSVLGPKPDEQTSVFTDRVLALAFSPDGSLLATGGGEASRSGQVTLWNVAEKTLIRELKEAHSDTVYGVEFSPDGKLLATASADKFAKVFDVATGEHVQSYEGHTHHVMDVSWKSDLTLLASAGADNAIKVWNAETGEQTRTISTYSKQVTSLNFVGMTEEILSSSGDKRVFLHKASNGGAVREFKGNPDYVYRVASTPDGALIVSGGEDGIVRVWNGKDAREVATFTP